MGGELAGGAGEQQPVQGRPRVRPRVPPCRLGQLRRRVTVPAGRPAPCCGTAPASRRADRPVRREGSRSPTRACRSVPGSASNPRRVDASAHEVQREVADHLGGRRHLDQPAEHPVRGRVRVLDRLEPVAQAERDGLLAQVGELAARDLVVVDPSGRGRQARLERGVQPADRLPVRLQVADRLQVQPGGAVGVVGRRDDRRQRRLAGRAGQAARRPVDGVGAGRDRREVGGELPARCVMRVEVDRQVEPLAQRRDQACRGGGRSRPAMSLIASTCAPASTICSASRR